MITDVVGLLRELAQLAALNGTAADLLPSVRNDDGEPMRVYWSTDPEWWSVELAGSDVPGGKIGLAGHANQLADRWPADVGLRLEHLYMRPFLEPSCIWWNDLERTVGNWASTPAQADQYRGALRSAAELCDRIRLWHEDLGWRRRAETRSRPR